MKALAGITFLLAACGSEPVPAAPAPPAGVWVRQGEPPVMLAGHLVTMHGKGSDGPVEIASEGQVSGLPWTLTSSTNPRLAISLGESFVTVLDWHAEPPAAFLAREPAFRAPVDVVLFPRHGQLRIGARGDRNAIDLSQVELHPDRTPAAADFAWGTVQRTSGIELDEADVKKATVRVGGAVDVGPVRVEVLAVEHDDRLQAHWVRIRLVRRP